MSKDNNLTDFLKDIADGIRAKKGTTAPINPQNFRQEIEVLDEKNPIEVESEAQLNSLLNAQANEGKFIKYGGKFFRLESNENYVEPSPETFTVNIVNNTIYKGDTYEPLFTYTIKCGQTTLYSGNGNTSLSVASGSQIKIVCTMVSQVSSVATFNWALSGGLAKNEYVLGEGNGDITVFVSGNGTMTLTCR